MARNWSKQRLGMRKEGAALKAVKTSSLVDLSYILRVFENIKFVVK